MNERKPSHWPITLTNGFAAILNIFLPLTLVRILTPDELGRYRIFFLYVGVGQGLFLTAGLANGLYHWTGKYPETKSEIRQSWTLCLAICLAVSVLALICSKFVASWTHAAAFDLQLFLATMPFFLAAGFFDDLFISRGDIWTGSLYTSGFSIVSTFSILAAAWWWRRVDVTLWAFLGATVLRVLVGWLLHVKSGDITPLFSRTAASDVLRYSAPVSIAAIMGLLLSNFDQMILSFRLSPSQFAFYSIGCLSLPPLDIFETSVNRVLIPRLSRAFSAGEREAAATMFSEAVSELWFFLLLATAGMVIYARPIIVILFTERYAAAAGYLRLFAFSYLLTSIPYDAIARARGDGRWILKTAMWFVPLTLILTYLGVNRWNAMGGLVAVLVVKLLLRIYSLTYDRKQLGVRYARFVPGRSMLIDSVFLLAGSVVVLALQPFFLDPRIWFLVTGPLLVLIYFSATYALLLSRLVTGAGSEVLHLSAASVGFSPLMAAQLLRTVIAEKKRVIHAHDLSLLLYGTIVHVLLLGRVRLELTIHSSSDVQSGSLRRLFYRILLRFPNRVVAVSEMIRSELTALGVDGGRIELAVSPIPLEASYAALAPQEGHSLA